MAMEEVLDSVRRIVHKWANTITPLAADASVGDIQINVFNSYRFQIGDQVMLKDASFYETGLAIEGIDRENHRITLNTPILNNWTMAQDAQFVKTIHEQFIQGIYIGDPDVIPRYPAITVNGTNRSSEWLTLESTKERFEIELTVLVRDATHESGYRFLLNLTDTIQQGLKANIIPLVNDYDIISLTEDAVAGSTDIVISDSSKVAIPNRRILIEDNFNMQESWITRIFEEGNPSGGTRVHIQSPLCFNFSASDTSVVVPHRFIFNSWPASIEYGKIHKGELLKASVIKWFAEEEELQRFDHLEPQLK